MILVTGATGTIGKHICSIAAPHTVKLMVRDVTRLTEESRKKFVWAAGDFSDPASLAEALAGIHSALLLTKPSPSQFEYDSNFISAAKTAGVKKIVKISALGASQDAISILNQWQHKSEQLLIGSGLEYVILQPQFFMQNLLMFGRAIKSKGEFGFPVSDYRIAMINAADIAACALAALTDDELSGQVLTLTGPEALSMDRVAQTISDETGQPVKYRAVNKESYIAKLKAAGLPDWSAEGLGDIYDDMRQFDGYCSDKVERLTGAPPSSIAEFLKPHRNKFASVN